MYDVQEGFHVCCSGGRAGEGSPCLMQKPERLCTVRSNASWVMVTWGPILDRMTERWTDMTEHITFLNFVGGKVIN